MSISAISSSSTVYQPTATTGGSTGPITDPVTGPVTGPGTGPVTGPTDPTPTPTPDPITVDLGNGHGKGNAYGLYDQNGRGANRSGLGDGTNPGQGGGRVNSPNEGTDNPNKAGKA